MATASLITTNGIRLGKFVGLSDSEAHLVKQYVEHLLEQKRRSRKDRQQNGTGTLKANKKGARS